MQESARRDLSSHLTVFILSTGDQRNLAECLAHMERQTVRFRTELISGVAPLSEALQQMIQRCTTRYFIQVDEDMLLRTSAVEVLYDALIGCRKETAIVCASLWDCFMDSAIYGVKIYSHDIVQRFPYRNTLSSEWEQVKDLQLSGYKIVLFRRGPKCWCLGEHGKQYTEEALFKRFRRLFWKHRVYRHMRWLDAWPERLMSTYSRTGSPLDLCALLGAIAGLTSDPPNTESDFREECKDFQRLKTYFDKLKPDDGR